MCSSRPLCSSRRFEYLPIKKADKTWTLLINRYWLEYFRDMCVHMARKCFPCSNTRRLKTPVNFIQNRTICSSRPLCSSRRFEYLPIKKADKIWTLLINRYWFECFRDMCVHMARKCFPCSNTRRIKAPVNFTSKSNNVFIQTVVFIATFRIHSYKESG